MSVGAREAGACRGKPEPRDACLRIQLPAPAHCHSPGEGWARPSGNNYVVSLVVSAVERVRLCVWCV